ncbi:MAG: 2-amino-4-hydroxy-6-hydroxymethyldihydropteridine diphosphokinase [Dokdonella sp.]
MTAAVGLNRVYLSLGSNIEPEQHLRAAIAALHAQFGDLLVSSVHRTEAVGFDGPAFLNLAVGLDTDWTPQQLDRWLHALEDRHGRRRDVERYSSRTLDIDIVLFGDLIVDGPGHLQIPRDELKHAFVLAPLAEIAPFARHPQSGRSISELWRAHAQYDSAADIVSLD